MIKQKLSGVAPAYSTLGHLKQEDGKFEVNLTYRENSRPGMGYKEKGGSDKEKGRRGRRRKKSYLVSVPIS